MKTKPLHMAFLFFAGMISACTPDPIEPPADTNEEEIITTLTLTLTDSADAAKTVTATFRDADGEGGNTPTIDSLKLDANTTYFATVTLLDETKSPAVDISEEVEEEANEHQLFYSAGNVNVAFYYEDKDSNNPPLPLGLNTKWRTGNAGTGTVRIILKHQPNTKSNNINSGETDIDITFPTLIK